MTDDIPIIDEDEELDSEGLGDTLSPYSLFSVFLEWKVLDSTHPDLTYIPLEYIEYISNAVEGTDEYGDIIHLMMLFSEHAQLNQTGVRKIKLDEHTYSRMAKEFALLCELEMSRRNGQLTSVHVTDIFNPNIKTRFQVMRKTKIPAELEKKVKEAGIDIQDSY